MSQPIRDQGGHLVFPIALKNTNLVVDVEILLPQPIRDQGGHLVFPISPKNTNLVEDVKILLPVRFRRIPLSGFRGEVENVKS